MSDIPIGRAWFWLLIIAILLLIIYCVLLIFNQYTEWSWLLIIASILLFLIAVAFYAIPVIAEHHDVESSRLVTQDVNARETTSAACPISKVITADQLI